MHAAGVDLEEVALVDGNLVQKIAPTALVHQLCELIAGRGALSHNDGGVRIAIQYVPALALAQRAVLVLGGVRVIGMHLNGQVAGSVDNLDQQGKAIAFDIAKKVAALIPQLRQRHALELWIQHGAVAVGVGRDGPAFAGFIRRNVIPICVAHTRTAPDLLVEHGLEFDDVCHDSPNSLSMAIGSII